MQMNQDFFNSLPPDDKEVIENLYQSLTNEEITIPEFFTTIKESLGETILHNLFTPHQDEPRDTNEYPGNMKTEHLADIIQCSGIDLKHEQEFIIESGEDRSYYDDQVDRHMVLDSLVDSKIFYEFIYKILNVRQINISDDCYHTLFMILKRKMTDLVERMINASHIRVDIERSSFEKNIINDVKRQLWMLEQNEQREMEKLNIKTDDEQKKKTKRIIQEREDLLIKKRMSNTVALAALGSKRFNWMDDTEEKKESVMQSLYAPYDEKEFNEKIRDRIITREDFLYVMEHDKRYNKRLRKTLECTGLDRRRCIEEDGIEEEIEESIGKMCSNDAIIKAV